MMGFTNRSVLLRFYFCMFKPLPAFWSGAPYHNQAPSLTQPNRHSSSFFHIFPFDPIDHSTFHDVYADDDAPAARAFTADGGGGLPAMPVMPAAATVR
jgi:hypothetical protein